MNSKIMNPSAIAALTKADDIFGTIKERYGVPPEWNRPPGFVTLCRIILEQQVSLESAYATYQKLESGIGNLTPENLLKYSREELRQYAVSRQKARYLHELSEAVLSGQLELERLPDKEESIMRAEMTAIPGIGNWTVDVYAMLCLQHPDIFPPGDIAAIRAVRELTTLHDKDDILQRSTEWAPHRTAATFFLWHFYLERRGRSVAHIYAH